MRLENKLDGRQKSDWDARDAKVGLGAKVSFGGQTQAVDTVRLGGKCQTVRKMSGWDVKARL